MKRDEKLFFFNNLCGSYSIFVPFESMDSKYRPISGVIFAKEQIKQNQRAKDIMDKLDYAGDGKIHYTEWRKFALEAIEENLNSEIQGEPRQTF